MPCKRSSRALMGVVWVGGSLSSLDLLSILIRGRDLAPSPQAEVILWVIYLAALAAALAWRSLPDRNRDGIPDTFQRKPDA